MAELKDFVYDIPVKVYFGKKQMDKLGAELAKLGKKVLMVYGGGSIKRNGLYDQAVEQIKEAGLELFELPGIDPNPRIESVRKGVEICKSEGIDMVLAIGGGSTIDASKVIAAGAKSEADPWDFFKGKAKITEGLPIVTILTISATGSEMDKAAVISSMDTNEKLGLFADAFYPTASFLNPENTYTVSSFQTASGAADIMSHVMEVYFNPEPCLYLLDGFMEVLMKTVVKYAPVALAEPDNYEARANLMWASSWAINGFIEYGKRHIWACHPMEHELSAFYDITHGLGLAILSPRWLEYSLDETTAPKVAQFARNIFEVEEADDMKAAKAGIAALSNFLFNTLGLKSTLTDIGIDSKNFDVMAEKACRGRVIESLKPLAKDDIKKIFEMCL